MLPVVIVHYHLLRGGVARVIELASQQLTIAKIPHVILSGTPYEGKYDLPVEVIEELTYREEGGSLSPSQLKEKLTTAAHRIVGKAPVIWHFHNHSIGKNALLVDTVALLAEEGERMLLQIHDFAEDGRASNYKHLDHNPHIYPIAPQIKYAFLNSRDQELMQHAGLPGNCSTILPNSIEPQTELPEPKSKADKPLVLYPTRSIRRKNLGDLFLLAALSKEDATYAVTLPPENEQWMGIYNDWKDFLLETQLPIELEVVGNKSPAKGAGSTYEEWLAYSTHIITTSVAEGFGLSFIEPQVIGKPLIGRNLPDITCDFHSHGIEHPYLYDKLLIPIEWIGFEELRQILCHDLRKLLETYGKDMSSDKVNIAFQSLIENGKVDFGNLPEHWQRKIILKVMEEKCEGDIFVRANGEERRAINWLACALITSKPAQGSSCLSAYTPKQNRTRLTSLYTAIENAEQRPVDWLSPHAVLKQFLKPERFHFLRT